MFDEMFWVASIVVRQGQQITVHASGFTEDRAVVHVLSKRQLEKLKVDYDREPDRVFVPFKDAIQVSANSPSASFSAPFAGPLFLLYQPSQVSRITCALAS